MYRNPLNSTLVKSVMKYRQLLEQPRGLGFAALGMAFFDA